MIRGQSNLGRTTGKKKSERLTMTMKTFVDMRRKLKYSSLSMQDMTLWWTVDSGLLGLQWQLPHRRVVRR